MTRTIDGNHPDCSSCVASGSTCSLACWVSDRSSQDPGRAGRHPLLSGRFVWARGVFGRQSRLGSSGKLVDCLPAQSYLRLAPAGFKFHRRKVQMAQIIWAIIVGAIAGSIARWISPLPKNRKGFLITIVLGIVGSEVGTFLGRLTRLYRPDQSAGIIASVVGALIILAIWHLIERSRQTP